MGKLNFWLRVSLTIVAGQSNAWAGGARPQLALGTGCQWLLLKTQSSFGKNPQAVPWTTLYQALRQNAESQSGSAGFLPELVASETNLRKTFGRLPLGQRARLVRHVVDRSYREYADATVSFRNALEDLHIETRGRTLSNATLVYKAWFNALQAENRAVIKEQTMLAYTDGLANMLGDLGTPHLDQYSALHLRPEYESHHWHLSPPVVEQMLFMSMRGYTPWRFSSHALEQSDLRGYSEQLIRKGLMHGKFSVLEARPELEQRALAADVTQESLRFKVNITGFAHEGREKNLVVIVKFERTPDSAEPFRTTIITTWNQNMRNRFTERIQSSADAAGVSLKNKVFRYKYRVASHNLLHDLTFYSITEHRAANLIRGLTKEVGRTNARVILRSTIEFFRTEMPKARIKRTIQKAYQDLYSQPL